MSNLLQVIRMASQAMKKGGVPVMVEFQVPPEAAPYLVSSTKSFLWVEAVHPGNIVKAAVRKIQSPGEAFWEVAQMVMARGVENKWGNTQPFTEAGVREAIEYVKSYDLADLEILIPRLPSEEPKVPKKVGKLIKKALRKAKKTAKKIERPEWLNPKNFQLPCRPTSWLQGNCAVVLPRDRQFVGMIGHLDMNTVVICVHNPSRGMAFARGK